MSDSTRIGRAELEQRIDAAVADGLAPNFARWLTFIGAEPGEWVELQALRVLTRYGQRNRVAHVDSLAAALPLLRQAEGFDAQGVFVIANRVDPAVATRHAPRAWHNAEKGASTTDKDVTHRRVLFIDVDAVRTTGTSATDEEMRHSVEMAGAVFARLAALLGGASALGYGHSGNGRQVFVAIEPTPEPSAAAALAKGILCALSLQFASPGAEIDRTVADAKRLVPAFGTTKRKGAAGVPDRPHRQTAFVCAEHVVPVCVADLERVAAELAVSLTPAQQRQVDAAMGRKSTDSWRAAMRGKRGKPAANPFDRANAIAVDEVASALGLLDDGRVRCPGCGNTDGVALVGNGLKCHHKSCAHLGVPGTSGFRTPVDLVAEVRQVEPMVAAHWLLERFGGEGERGAQDAGADGADASAPPPIAPPVDLAPINGRDFPLTDGGNAERFAAHHGADLLHCHDWKKWLEWNGSRWALDRRAGVEFRAFQTARAIPAEAVRAEQPMKRKALQKHAKRSDSAGAIRNMVSLARARPELTVLADELDADPWLFNCSNGTVDLRTGALRPHSRKDRITKAAPVAYEPHAECPRWRAFLSDVMGGNEELVAFLQRAVGYSLTGDVGEQVLFFLHGAGSNGKSTFLRTLLEIFGDYGLQTAPDLLIAKHHDTHPTAVADLFGRRLAVCQELESGKTFAEATVKQLTGGDIVRARRMREDFWSFRPTHKLFLAANHKPTVRGTDYAIWRRIQLIPFTVTIAGDKKDPGLLEKLLAERAGILRWAVEGCLAWQAAGGLRAPKEVVDATSAYQHEQDVVGEFLEDRCEVDARAEVWSRDLLRDYRQWCEANGHRELSPKGLSLQLSSRGLRAVKGHAGQRKWLGVRLRRRDDAFGERDVPPSDVNREPVEAFVLDEL